LGFKGFDGIHAQPAIARHENRPIKN